MITVKQLKTLLDSMPDDWDDKEIQFKDTNASSIHEIEGEFETTTRKIARPWDGVVGSGTKYDIVIDKVRLS